MSITYGWFLVPTLGIERTVEFARTIPNSGITEIVDRKLVDLFKRGRKVTTEPSDGGASKGPFVKMVLAEAKMHARGGGIGYDEASYLELAQCILVEGLGKNRRPSMATLVTISSRSSGAFAI